MSETLTYGLNAGGFVRMRLPEIKRDIFDEIAARTGFPVDEKPDSFTGQFVSVFAEREAMMWELMEQVYLSPYPASAPDGVPLDYAVSYAGVRRLQPVRSRATARLNGMPGTVIPQRAIVQASIASDAADIPPRFFLEAQTTITKAEAVGASLSISSPIVPGESYWLDIDGVRYSVTAASGDTVAQVAVKLDTLLGTLSFPENEKLILSKTEKFSVDWSSNISVNYITAAGQLLAEEFGRVPAAAGTLTNIISNIDGWQSVVNIGDAVLGQSLETGDALRERYAFGVYRLGAGTLPSIYANIQQDVPGVTSLRVFENNTDATDNEGRPPHSIELVIEGGDNDAIFRKIQAIKPAGIPARGNTMGTVRAEDGYLHSVGFSRPEPRWIWLRVALATNAEEQIPGDLQGQVVRAILAVGARFTAGQDIILQRLAAAPFAAIPSLARVTITAAVTGPNAPLPSAGAFVATDIPMGSRQKAAFDISRIAFV